MSPETGGFAVLADRIRADGEPYVGGTLLQMTADRARLVCQVHGELTPELRDRDGLLRWSGDWMYLCQAAMRHVRDDGCVVAVESWRGAVYGPGSQAEPTGEGEEADGGEAAD